MKQWSVVLASILPLGCGDRTPPPESRPLAATTPESIALPKAALPTAPSVAPIRPLFVSELAAGEGRPQFVTAAASLPLHAEPSLAATVADSLLLPVGTPIEYDEERYQTMRAGVISIVAPLQVTGRNFGPLQYLSREAYYSGAFPSDTITLSAGTTADYLMYRAEGTCFIRVGENVIDADRCPVGAIQYPYDPTAVTAHLERDAEIEWWIHITRSGEPRGWALVEDRTMQVARRRRPSVPPN